MEEQCGLWVGNSWGILSICTRFYLWLSKVSANEKSPYICDVFSYYLRPCSAIYVDRKRTLDSDELEDGNEQSNTNDTTATYNENNSHISEHNQGKQRTIVNVHI